MSLWRGFLVVGLTLALLPLACRQLSPEERVESLRGQYTAELNSFYVEAPAEQAEGAEVGEEASAAESSAAAEAGEAEAGEEGEEGTEEGSAAEPALTNVVLDILVSTEALDYLPGITVDASQADAAGNEKAHWRLWVDTSQVVRGAGSQVTKVLEGVSYEEGDGFFVEVRHPVPAAERGEYKEFSEAS